MRFPAARTLLLVATGIGGLYFAVEGGMYGTSDLISMRRERARTMREIDSLTRTVDSLAEYRQRLLSDTALQERIARESFGLVRSEKELIYRYVPMEGEADTPGRGGRR